MLYLLLLLVKEIGFKNEREEMRFYFIGLGEILDLLPTYPFKGSKFHVVLFQNVFCEFCSIFSFENGFEERERSRVGIRIENK